MSLEKYIQKRNFKKTPEPKGKVERTGKHRFVVQEHHASRLHYDFRLEAEGVLKSWAVPKGVSMNPKDKRLAVMTEDHPVDYIDFEGNIPEGYGAGDVYLWDEGKYELEDSESFSDAFKDGKLRFTLQGKKLQGAFQMVRMKDDEKQWLLMKIKDEYASSGTNDEIQSAPTPTKSTITGRAEARKNKTAAGKKKTDEAAPAPGDLITPMLATLGSNKPFDDENWIFEPKLDGYRAIAEVKAGKVKLYSRTGQNFEKTYAPIVEVLKHLQVDAILDGEIVALNENGIPHFNLIQKYKSDKKGKLQFYVFDLLSLEGEDTTGLPLLQRKDLLRQVLDNLPGISFCEHFNGKGKEFFKMMKKEGLEGMVAKKADSTYTPGVRSTEWLKIKFVNTADAIIGGFTEAKDSREFGAILLGMYDEDGEFHFTGHCGTGFDRKKIKELYKKFAPLKMDYCPFAERPVANARVTWIRPELVCEVAYSEWTKAGVLRHPSFQRLRDDKLAEDVRLENERGGKLTVVKDKISVDPPRSGRMEHPVGGSNSKKQRTKKAAMKDTWKSNDFKPEGQGGTLKIKKNEVRLTSLDKLYFPKKNLTKGDLLDYYIQVADYILPYLKNRPESLRRTPDGVGGKDFFQKDINFKVPAYAETARFFSEGAGKDIDWLVCNNLETLLFMVNLGAIEINPWNSTVKKPENPDYAAIDLDPGDKTTFSQVVETCLVCKEILDGADIPAYCKTSGSRGLHVFIPLGGKYDYDQSRDFVHSLMLLVHQRLPKITSLERSPNERRSQIYLDYLQNKQGQTLVAPYSARPRENATVSTPLHWREVNEQLKIADFTIETMPERLNKEGDLWKPVLGKGLDMEKALKKLMR